MTAYLADIPGGSAVGSIAAPSPCRSLRRRLDVSGIDVRSTLRPLGVYGRDPTHRWGPNWFAKAVLTPAGPGTLRLTWDRHGCVDAEAWGAGASWLLDVAPRWVGLDDDLTGFDPSTHPWVAERWRRNPGIRLPAAGVIWQELLLVLLGQRVTTTEATRSWARLVYRWGTPAPGPCELRLPPPPGALAGRSYVDFHRFGVERHRADAILTAARRADRLEEAAAMTPQAALTRLTALRGHGVWTATSVIAVSLGDPDTVVLRDYGLPTTINYAFTGDARRLVAAEGGDEIMCAHLAPWSGHRRRIVRLVLTAGISPPRRAPRAWNPDIRRL